MTVIESSKLTDKKVSWANSNMTLVEHFSAIDLEVLNRRYQGHLSHLMGGETKAEIEPPVCPVYQWDGSNPNAGFQSSALALCARWCCWHRVLRDRDICSRSSPIFKKHQGNTRNIKLRLKSLCRSCCQNLPPKYLFLLRLPTSPHSLFFTHLMIERSEGELLWLSCP